MLWHNIVGLEVEQKTASCKSNYRRKIVVELEVNERRQCFDSSATSCGELLQYAATFWVDIIFSSTLIV